MDPTGIVRDLYDAFRRKDNEALLRILHPDVEWFQNVRFPGGGHHVSAERVFNDTFRSSLEQNEPARSRDLRGKQCGSAAFDP
ncbi:MAG: hypothetical protein ACKVWV_11430 [Planctomycetota bacterium]